MRFTLLLLAGLAQPIAAAGRQFDIHVPDRDSTPSETRVRFQFDHVPSLIGFPRSTRTVAKPRPVATSSFADGFAMDSVPEQGVEYSDAFYTRLAIHRWASFGMIPLFALEYIAGEQRLTKGRFAPAWAREAHLPLAVAVGGLFSVNTVTGLWNLAEASGDPYGRTRRTVHAVTMLIADFGFALTGILAPDITTIEQRLARGDTSWTPHKIVAVSSMGLSLVSYLLMLLWN